jgi:hypothetical protein
MPRVLFHGSIQSFRGRIGNLIFRQLPDGTTVVSEAPPEKTRRQKKRANLKRSPAQKAHNSRFREAVAYAKASQSHPVYVALAEAAPMNTAYNFALKDWLHAPEIHCMERRDGHIVVKATDNVMVSQVRVTVFDEAGKPLESVDGIRGEGNWWEFHPQSEGTKIVAQAWDLANNQVKFELTL